MTRSDSTTLVRHGFALWCGVVAIAALYFAKEVLLPLALSILLTFLLAPIVKRLERWRVPRIPAVLLTVGVAFAGICALSYMLVVQLYDLAYHLPEYKDNITAKVASLHSNEPGVLENVKRSLQDVRKQFEQRTGLPSSSAGDATEAIRPTPVEIVDDLSAAEIAQSILGPVISPLGTAAMVIVFVVFMLLEREHLRNRLIHLIASGQLNIATQAFDDAGSRVSRFLLMQLIVNASFGAVIALGLMLIGLPNALLWGVLSMALRFIPYIGPAIAAIVPIAIASAVFPGWTRPMLVLCLFVVNELISNNVIEPWLYGASTGISTMGILVSAVFWTWLWGPVGLILATPLTVCLTVMGRYVPQLSFINTLLSEDEVLPPASRLYQRLLAMDTEEAAEIAEDYLEGNSLEELYDNVLLPALSLAEQDRHDGNLEEVKERYILTAMKEMIEEAGAKASPDASSSHAVPDKRDEILSEIPVLCLPARDEADEIAASMLGQLLRKRRIRVIVASVQSLAGEMLAQVSEYSPAVVCISGVPPLAATHARYLCKRLRPTFPSLRIVVGLWQSTGRSKKVEARLKETGADEFVTTLAEASRQLALCVGSQQLLDRSDRALSK